MYGDVSVSKLVPLQKSQNRDKFERAQTDTFRCSLRPLGNLEKILVGHDGKMPGDGWYLDEVVIDDNATMMRYYFVHDRWLDKKQDDGEIERSAYIVMAHIAMAWRTTARSNGLSV